MAKIRNMELYEYIKNHYIETKQPVTIQEIANEFNMTIGAIKNFMYRHRLNKKEHYIKKRKQVNHYYEKGLTVAEIATLIGSSKQYIYYIRSKKDE